AGYTPAELALRWLWAQPQVTCVLSGMNSMEMVRENLEIADSASADGKTDFAPLVEAVKEEIRRFMKVGCSGCGYCMPWPYNVESARALHCYNGKYTEGRGSGMWEYLQSTAKRRETTSACPCIRCGRCEKHCPQQIPIRKKLQEAVKELETPKYKAI